MGQAVEGVAHCPSAPVTFLGEQIPKEIWGLCSSQYWKFGEEEGPRALQVAQQGDGFSGRRGGTWFPRDIPSYSWAVWEQLLLLPLCWSESSWLGFVGFSPPGMLCEQRILHRYRDLTSRWKSRALSPECSVIPDLWTSFVRQSDIILKEGKCFPKDRLCSLKNTSDIITLHRFLVGNKQSLKTARAVKIYGIKIYSVKIFIP